MSVIRKLKTPATFMMQRIRELRAIVIVRPQRLIMNETESIGSLKKSDWLISCTNTMI